MGKFTITKKLADLVTTAKSPGEFKARILELKNTDLNEWIKLDRELTKIYMLRECKELDIPGINADEMVYINLRIQGFDVAQPKKYQIILGEDIFSGTGARWNYYYACITECGNVSIRFTDVYDTIDTVSEDDLDKLPAYMKDIAKEVN